MDYETLSQFFENSDSPLRPYRAGVCNGRQCAGIEVNNVNEFYANLVQLAMDDAFDMSDARDLIADAKTDNMGMSTIVYWPEIEWVDENAL